MYVCTKYWKYWYLPYTSVLQHRHIGFRAKPKGSSLSLECCTWNLTSRICFPVQAHCIDSTHVCVSSQNHSHQNRWFCRRSMYQKNGTTIWGKPKLILIENWGSSCFVCHDSPRRPTTLLCRFEQLKSLGGRNARLQKYDLKTQTPWNGDCTPKQLILHCYFNLSMGF